MTDLYAFLAGINAYPPEGSARPLFGCVNDVEAARALLAHRTGGAARTTVVRDAEVTVAAVEDGVRRFLGAAGDGDTAVFWFSGHGTHTWASGSALLTEATGRSQALLCADGTLADQRLGALLDEVAARGAHVVAVVDCCFSGGATRDVGGLTARFAPPAEPPPPALLARDVPLRQGQERHVLLAASRLDQLSYEGHFGGRPHGAFTHALLGAVRAAGPDATYRELLAAADARVQRGGGLQQPVLYPAAPGIADRPFLGGALAQTPGPHRLRYGPQGWEVDCGTGHGLREGAGAEGTEFRVVREEAREAPGDTSPDTPAPAAPAAPDREPEARVVRARDVRADRALVTPVGWEPDPDRAYPVALSALALAPATVAFEAAPDAVGVLRSALALAGPGGVPAPLLRAVGAPEDTGDPHFRVLVRDGRARVLRRDGTPFTGPLPFSGTDEDALRVVDCLAHLTRWHQLRDLTPRPSVLDNLIQVEITPWGAPPGQALVPDGSGEIVRAYGSDGSDGSYGSYGSDATDATDSAGSREPWVSIRLHNRSPRRTLWCVLLDLTDSYASHSTLFPGDLIGPGHTGYALEGDPVQLSLPASRPAVPGAYARDWLKLIVAEGELNTVPFHLPAWDPRGGATARSRPAAGFDVLRVEAPRRPSGTRELGRVGGAASPGLWTARTVCLRTVVPGDAPTAPGG
ncbi:caspase family protein [Streptomyces sp. PmtG]